MDAINSTLIELHFLPSLEYFILIQNSDEVIIEAHERFNKQTFRNRCYLNGANKIEMLSVPIKKRGSGLIRDIEIDYDQSWVNIHWKTITSAYGKSPFFEYYRDGFESILFRKEKYLFDLNFAFLTKCLDYLSWEIPTKLTEKYEKEPKRHLFDRRSLVLPNKSYSSRNFYCAFPYQQIFGKGFAGNLSIIDLLFCMGPSSSSVLSQSKGSGLEH